MNLSNKYLKLTTMNVRSLRTSKQLNKLKSAIAELDPDVLCLTETNLQHDRPIRILGYYAAANTPRPLNHKKSGGGTAILIKNHIQSMEIDIDLPNSEDIQCSSVRINDITISCIYRRPKNDFNDEDKRLFEKIMIYKEKHIATGDLNLHTCWETWTHKNNAANESMTKMMQQGFIQSIVEVTRPKKDEEDDGNILDVFLTRNHEHIRNSEVNKEIAISDHFPISCQFLAKQPPLKKESLIIEDLKNTKWEIYQEKLAKDLLNVEKIQDTNEMNNKITNIIKSGWKSSVKTKTISFVNGKPVFPLTQKTIDKKKELKKLRKKCSRDGNSQELRKECKKLQKEIQSLVAQDIYKVQTSYLEKYGYSSKAVKRYLKKFRQVEDQFGPLKEDDDVNKPEIQDEMIAANIMRDHFVSVYKEVDMFDEEYVPKSNPPKMYDLNFKEEETYEEIMNLNNTGAKSFDELSATMFKKAARIIAKPLTELFRRVYAEEKYPDNWIKSVTCPIHKGGIKYKRTRYRPVSLVSVILKIYEAILFKHCSGWVSNRNVWPERKGYIAGWSEKQFAYLPRSSVEGNLVSVNKRIQVAKQNNLQLTTIYADAKSAFDALSFKNIGQALAEMGIPRKIISGIMYGLVNRTFMVKINDKFSEPAKATSGILQGSKMSGFIFNSCINTVFDTAPEDVCPRSGLPYVAMYGYADDIKSSYISSDERGHQLMAEHQIRLQKWAEDNTYYIHPEKLIMLKMGESNINRQIKVGETIVREKETHRDLGVIYNKDGLDFTSTWDSKIAQMTRKSIDLRSNIKSRSVIVLKQMWNTYLNSILMFGLSVIGYPTDKQIKKLQNIQRLFFEGTYECSRNCQKRNKKSDYCPQHELPDPIDIIILKRDLMNYNRMRLGFMRTIEPISTSSEEDEFVFNARTRNRTTGAKNQTAKSKQERMFFENRVRGDFLKIPSGIRNNIKKFSRFVKYDKNCHLNHHINMRRDPKNKKILIGSYKCSHDGEYGPPARKERRKNMCQPFWPTI